MTSPQNSAPRTFLGVQLSNAILPSNLIGFYGACFAGILLSTFMPQMQPYVLSEFLQIPEKEQGVVSGNIAFWGEIAIIIAAGFWGTMSDKVGRRHVMAVSFVIMAVGVAGFPFAQSYPQLIFFRIIFGVGVAAFSCMTITIMADYVNDRSRGKATGFLGLANGFGAMTTVFLILRLPAIFQGQGLDPHAAGMLTYFIIAGVSLLFAVWMWLSLKKHDVANQKTESDSFLEITKKGFRAAKDQGVALSYAAAFVSRGNLAIVGTFFTLWLANYGTSELGLSRADALARGGLIVGIAQGVTLIGAPLFGILSDRLARVDALIVSLLVSFIGYGGTFFIDDPFSTKMIICAIFIGLGEVGVIITSAVLIAQQTPAKIRGAVIGFFNLSGAVGILVAAKFGGYLFDNWRESGPFVLFGLLALAVTIWAVIIRKKVIPVA
ncbi:Putative metabolite transport protein YjhB [Zhongshania aliphaticivorans]|uniref:Metabolite transport protein YjhB n=1 Tax=Zhongshania aliphaticivorans TaxID=1470434 RepID=A0A5S9MYK9_9GAMM|nr:MFS transporter [Zhongshania aliphaticivorans]CAA0081988.1 Putative metabolite transport protein YjhB [Zhongshania aliphaticivorans]CAA0084535.1 Putative metabolite transport protein YjhB [Zhongshania aliphaticivorans]